MGYKTFKQGIHPHYHKEFSEKEPIKRCPLPKKVIIPLSQHTGKPCDPLVEKKAEVEEKDKEKGFFRKERRFGGVYRRLSLPKYVDIDKTEANLKDGILEIKVPKLKIEEKKKRQIEIT